MATELSPDTNLSRGVAAQAAYSEFLDALICEREAAQFLGFSIRTLQERRATGDGTKFYRLGRSIRYRRRDLLKYADDRVKHSTSET